MKVVFEIIVTLLVLKCIFFKKNNKSYKRKIYRFPDWKGDTDNK